MRVKYLLLLLVTLEMSGCISGTHSYSPPLATHVANSVVVKRSQDDVWTGLLARLDQKIFVIDQIDKDSGLIHLSYSGDPEKFVDCGIVKMTVKDSAGERSYQFPSARQNTAFESTDKGNLYNIRRSMNLDSKIDVQFKKASGTSTEVSVNCKYLITKNSEITLVGGSILESRPINVIDSVTFYTGGGNTFTNSTGTCNPTYALERLILSYTE